MARSRKKIIEDIIIKRPDLSKEEAEQYLATLETFCELVINYTMKHGELNEED